ncbi:MAG: DUF4179 domain-containing protein [Hungatella sp.]|nr:DUF4179 domain-containing protein [Hungatella sp.]
MREKEMDLLVKEIEIPEIVQRKADIAFKRIQEEDWERRRIISYRKARNRKFAVIVAATAGIMAAVTACTAAYLHWSRGLEAELHVTEAQKRYLEDIKIAAPAGEDSGVTSGGVTVTPVQSIVDSRFAFLSFKIEGYDLEEGKEPCFENIGITVDGSADFSWSASFYNGLTTDEMGRAVCQDGTLVQDLPEGVFAEQYVAEDGTMEYDVLMMANVEEGMFIDAPVHVVFENLGIVHKAEFFPDLEGRWEFDINLSGSDKVRHVMSGNEIGDSGAVVNHADISPISLQVTYDFEAQPEEIEGVGEDGQPITSTLYKEPPVLTGVRLKDGTLLVGICNGGMTSWEDLEKGIYKETFATSRVIDTEKVDALLYLKPDGNGETMFAEENLYIVPVE